VPLTTTRLRRDVFDVARTSPPARIFLALNLLALGLVMPQPLRAVIVLPLVLLLPGYAVFSSLGLAARRDPVLTAGASVALSLVIVPLVTLALWAVAGEVEPAQVTIVLAVIVLAPAVVGLQPLVSRKREPVVGSPAGLLRILAVFTVGVLLVVGLVSFLPGQRNAPFTEAALAGSWAEIDQAVRVQPDQPVSVDVMVTNRTGRDQTYAVEPELAGATWRGATVDLGPGQTWTGAVEGTVPAGGCLHRLRVGVRPASGATALEGPTVWFQTVDELPRSCVVGTAR
jgi:uncharacterized membrane protein